jgi:hypothetical protein
MHLAAMTGNIRSCIFERNGSHTTWIGWWGDRVFVFESIAPLASPHL